VVLQLNIQLLIIILHGTLCVTSSTINITVKLSIERLITTRSANAYHTKKPKNNAINRRFKKGEQGIELRLLHTTRWWLFCI